MFKKGDPKPPGSGMRKGQKIRTSVSFADDLERLGFNLADKLVEVFNSTSDVAMQVRLLELIAKYRVPVPKAAESVPEEAPVDETSADVLAIVK
jgi:hypothetical protein